jgi:hypothetical protein
MIALVDAVESRLVIPVRMHDGPQHLTVRRDHLIFTSPDAIAVFNQTVSTLQLVHSLPHGVRTPPLTDSLAVSAMYPQPLMFVAGAGELNMSWPQQSCFCMRSWSLLNIISSFV